MKNKTFFIAVGSLFVGLLIGALFLSKNYTASMMFGGRAMTGFRTMNSNWNMGTVMDKHFIEQMVPHHENAVEMAQLALERSKKMEIKNLANTIIESQSKEIKDMQKWYANWYGGEIPKNSSPTGSGIGMMGGRSIMGKMMNNETDIDFLKNAEDFDKTFIELMVPHHRIAIMMAQMLELGTNKPELKQLAKDIIESQSREIKEMQEWYLKWYP